MVASTEALASFEEKWSLAHPELPLALRFAKREMRPFISAMACLAFEVEFAAFNITEAGVAAGKLQWWAEELALLTTGKVRHPLTQILADSKALKALPPELWQAWVSAAFAQREAIPARNQMALLAGYRAFFEPLARIKSALYSNLSIDAEAQAGALCRVVVEAVRLPESLSAGRLPMPFDLLAQHGLSRAELGSAGSVRDALLREFLESLAKAIGALDRRGLLPLTAASLAVQLRRCRFASRAANPLEIGLRNLDRLPMSALWACWRAARRVQPGA
jgi:phytoene synthase